MTLSMLMFYAISCLAVTITPGPTMLLALSNGASRNRRIAVMGMLGAALSDVILIGAVGIGLGSLLAASATAFGVVKWVGVAYLVWLAIQLWRAAPAALAPDGHPAKSARKAFVRSLCVALSNPKGLLFFSAFLPQFINTARAQAPQYLLLALLTAIMDIAIMACYAMGGAQAARLLTARGLQRLNRACAVALASLAAFLSFYRKSDI